MKRQRGNEGEKYINFFPKLKKWINECLCCHEKVINGTKFREIKIIYKFIG